MKNRHLRYRGTKKIIKEKHLAKTAKTEDNYLLFLFVSNEIICTLTTWPWKGRQNFGPMTFVP